MVNFYRSYIPKAASILQPLYDLLKGKPSLKKTLQWDQPHQAAFDKSKEALSRATLLTHPSPTAELNMTVDASDVAVGAVLQQKEPGTSCWQPLGFFSKGLRSAELKYSTFDRELLAMYLAVRHFRYFLEGRQFTIYTDHKPLKQAFHKSSDPWSPRQQRHLSYISEFTTDIHHLSGKDNVVADNLSRPPIATVTTSLSGLDFRQMAADQLTDNNVHCFRSAVTDLKFQDIPIDDSQLSLLCDISTGKPRPVVPETWKRKVFEALHNMGHPSVRLTNRLAKERYVWHGMARDITRWAKTCIQCQQSKIQCHTRSPVDTFKVPARRFQHLNVDIVGPLPSSNGYRYLLTMIDRTTRWPEAIALKDITTESCAAALIEGWISRFGLPADITTDRGAQFTSQLWSTISTLLGIKLHHTTAYHPAANGMIERFHRSLKNSLKCRLQGSKWTTELPWVMLALRTTLKEDLEVSPAELCYGSQLAVPGDFLQEPSEQEVSKLPVSIRNKVLPLLPSVTSNHSRVKVNIPKALKDSVHVFIRRDAPKAPLVRPYEGPFKVLEKKDKTFLVDLDGKPDWVAIDRLKPAFTDSTQPVPVASRPKRGRPKKTDL